jgi:hypothetical protein
MRDIEEPRQGRTTATTTTTTATIKRREQQQQEALSSSATAQSGSEVDAGFFDPKPETTSTGPVP